jgi:CRP-like cAMP-binding protein
VCGRRDHGHVAPRRVARPWRHAIPDVVAAASGGVPAEGNLLLSGLPAADTERLTAQAHHVRLDRKATLMTPGSRINHVYFPETGALSELVVMADGAAVEVGFIGREGMAGWPAVFGSLVSGIWVVCQTGGHFLQFATTELAAEVDRNPELHRRLHHHAAAVIGQRSISAACDRHHDVVARAARHLLAAHDLGLDDELVVTHEFLALRLGVQRPTVTVALTELERLGAITRGRGHVAVVDRAGLEQITCECYWAIRREIGRHLDWLPAPLGAWFSDANGVA